MIARPSPKSPWRAQRRAIRFLLVSLLISLGAGCSSAVERPTEAAWKLEWEQRQQLIPDAETISLGGRQLCDDLDGEFRVALPELIPSPSEVLDDPVKEWTSHAVSIVFECSEDPATIVEQLKTLDVLAGEIDGGLGSEGG